MPLFLQHPVPYTQDAPTPLLVSQSPSKLRFGNPYSVSDSKGWSPFQKVTNPFSWNSVALGFSDSSDITKLTNSSYSISLNPLLADEEDEEFSDDQLLRLPPVGPPSWDSNVVCIQPTRNHSRPEGHEDSEEKQNNNVSISDGDLCILSHVHHAVKYLSDFPFVQCFFFFFYVVIFCLGWYQWRASSNWNSQSICDWRTNRLLLWSQVTQNPHAQTLINAVLICCSFHFSKHVHLNMCKVFVLLCSSFLLVLVKEQATHDASDRCCLLACAPCLPTSLAYCWRFISLPLFFFCPLSACAAWTWRDAHCVKSSSRPTMTRASLRSMWKVTGKSAPCAVSSSHWTATKRCLRIMCSLILMATRSTSTREAESQQIQFAYFLSPLK